MIGITHFENRLPNGFHKTVLKAVLLILNISNTTVQNSTDFTQIGTLVTIDDT